MTKYRTAFWILLGGGSLFSPAVLLAQTPSLAQYVEGMSRGLDRVIESLSGGPRTGTRRPGLKTAGTVEQVSRGGLVFSANMNFAHRQYVRACSAELLISYADALKELGAKRIDINPGLWPWSKHDEADIAKYDALVSHIKQIGLQLAWNPAYFPQDLRVGALADYQKAALPIYAEMARRYKPDIFTVVHEPTTMTSRMGIQASPEEWRGFVEKAVQVVKEASPQTRVAAGAMHSEMPYFETFAAMPGLDILTVDIYFLKALPTFARMAELAHTHGKEVYMEETWRYTVLKAASGDGTAKRDVANQAYEDLDIKWLQAMVLFANKYGLSAITPFWSTAFFTYLPESWDASDRHFLESVVQDIKAGKRTRYAQKYRELAKQYGR